METFLEILKFLLPSAVVFITAWFLVRNFLQQELKRRELNARSEYRNAALPVRMQAYERLVLLLERIQPAGLIIRVNAPGMTAAGLHTLLLQAIRDEFDHNLSQQLYVSAKTWELVRNAREATIQMINSAAARVPNDGTTAELAEKILTMDLETTHAAIDQALHHLKLEAHETFF